MFSWPVKSVFFSTQQGFAFHTCILISKCPFMFYGIGNLRTLTGSGFHFLPNFSFRYILGNKLLDLVDQTMIKIQL